MIQQELTHQFAQCVAIDAGKRLDQRVFVHVHPVKHFHVDSILIVASNRHGAQNRQDDRCNIAKNVGGILGTEWTNLELVFANRDVAHLYTIHAQLTALFNYAQTFYGLQFNPCDAAGYMGSSIAGEMLIITKDQYEILRKEFRNEAYLLAFDILFWTGCREGEMLALLPKDLTDDDQLRIYKTYHRKKGQDILGPTKNSKKGGNRNVPIPHWLAEEFRTYCSKLYGLTPDDRVFYMTCTALNKELTRCTQITYLPDIRVHDLRHSHVSLCIELGYSIVLVAKRIGDTVPVVMRTYAHLYPNKQQELVSRLETLSTSSSSKDESDLMPLV